MKISLKQFALFLVLFVAVGCSTRGKLKQFEQDTHEVSVMAYNVENLFDTIHDEGTEDHSYLPLTEKDNEEHRDRCSKVRSRKYRSQCLTLDWSEELLMRKMDRLGTAILQVNGGYGPDVLIMEEVENIRVLSLLNTGHLQKAGYQTVILIEGPDKRGIDIAMLSRLKLAKPAKLHKIPFKGKNANDSKWMNRSRGILQADFILPDGEILTTYGVHFPNPNNPKYWREQAITFLNKLVSELPKGRLAVAGGDFNIAKKEDRHLYDGPLASKWLVSHRIGCRDCRGTNYYHTLRSWSFLDALTFSKNMDKKTGNGEWYVEPKSINIPKYTTYQVNRFASPARFDVEGAVGVSDHWPIYARIRKRKPPANFAVGE